MTTRWTRRNCWQALGHVSVTAQIFLSADCKPLLPLLGNAPVVAAYFMKYCKWHNETFTLDSFNNDTKLRGAIKSVSKSCWPSTFMSVCENTLIIQAQRPPTNIIWSFLVIMVHWFNENESWDVLVLNVCVALHTGDDLEPGRSGTGVKEPGEDDQPPHGRGPLHVFQHRRQPLRHHLQGQKDPARRVALRKPAAGEHGSSRHLGEFTGWKISRNNLAWKRKLARVTRMYGKAIISLQVLLLAQPGLPSRTTQPKVTPPGRGHDSTHLWITRHTHPISLLRSFLLPKPKHYITASQPWS